MTVPCWVSHSLRGSSAVGGSSLGAAFVAPSADVSTVDTATVSVGVAAGMVVDSVIEAAMPDAPLTGLEAMPASSLVVVFSFVSIFTYGGLSSTASKHFFFCTEI